MKATTKKPGSAPRPTLVIEFGVYFNYLLSCVASLLVNIIVTNESGNIFSYVSVCLSLCQLFKGLTWKLFSEYIGYVRM